jgi:hypothetical protein
LLSKPVNISANYPQISVLPVLECSAAVPKSGGSSNEGMKGVFPNGSIFGVPDFVTDVAASDGLAKSGTKME